MVARAGRKTSLAKGRPDLVDLIDGSNPINEGLTPSRVTLGSKRPVAWAFHCPDCNNCHEWQSTIAEQIQAGISCPVCSSERLDSQSLKALRPDLSAAWSNVMNGALQPEDVLADSLQEVWWDCSTHGPYQLAVHARVTDKQGCPDCAQQPAALVGEQRSKLSEVASELAGSWQQNVGELLLGADKLAADSSWRACIPSTDLHLFDNVVQ